MDRPKSLLVFMSVISLENVGERTRTMDTPNIIVESTICYLCDEILIKKLFNNNKLQPNRKMFMNCLLKYCLLQKVKDLTKFITEKHRQ